MLSTLTEAPPRAEKNRPDTPGMLLMLSLTVVEQSYAQHNAMVHASISGKYVFWSVNNYVCKCVCMYVCTYAC